MSPAQSPKSAGRPQKRTYTLAQQLQGFPVTQILILMVVRFAEPVAFTSLFPYVFFMVKHLRPHDSEASIARYAGYISGSFAACQALTGVVWGRASDKYGRKPLLIMGLMGSSLSMLWFGLAPWGGFWMALVARSLGGLLNGNVGVLRTALGEIASERRHQALAFSTMPLLWQVGCVVGPMLGGSLASPVDNHPDWFKHGGNAEKLFSQHPFLLPNLVVAAMLLSSAVFAFLFLEEPHEVLGPMRNKSDPGLKIGDAILRALSRGRVTRLREKEESHIEDEETEGEEEENEHTGLLKHNSGDDNTRYVSEVDENGLQTDADKASGPVLTQQVRVAIGSYAIMSMTATVLDELLPVMLSTSPSPSHFPFHLVGGIGMNSAQVGSLISSTGTLGIILMLFLFPLVDGRFGTLAPYRIVFIVFPILCFAIPYLVLLPGNGNDPSGSSANNSVSQIQYYGALFTYFSKTTLGSLGFPESQLLVQRAAAHRSHLGEINGLSQMFAAGARAFGPIVWGFLMAAGQKFSIAWVPWWVLGATTLIGAYFSRQIVETDD